MSFWIRFWTRTLRRARCWRITRRGWGTRVWRRAFLFFFIFIRRIFRLMLFIRLLFSFFLWMRSGSTSPGFILMTRSCIISIILVLIIIITWLMIFRRRFIFLLSVSFRWWRWWRSAWFFWFFFIFIFIFLLLRWCLLLLMLMCFRLLVLFIFIISFLSIFLTVWWMRRTRSLFTLFSLLFTFWTWNFIIIIIGTIFIVLI